MSLLKEKMYNYEIAPPEGTWMSIYQRLALNKTAKLRTMHRFSYTIIAASVILFLIVSIFFSWRPESGNDVGKTPYIVINEQEEKEAPLSSESNASNLKASYILLLGPQGKVKVSKKVAAIFTDPAMDRKEEWKKKLTHWKNIMMTASNTDFLDVISLTENAESEN